MKADSKSKIVVIKGKTVDPVKICERVQKKTGKKVELISPLPKPPEEEKKEENKEAEEEKKEEVLYLHFVLLKKEFNRVGNCFFTLSLVYY